MFPEFCEVAVAKFMTAANVPSPLPVRIAIAPLCVFADGEVGYTIRIQVSDSKRSGTVATGTVRQSRLETAISITQENCYIVDAVVVGVACGKVQNPIPIEVTHHKPQRRIANWRICSSSSKGSVSVAQQDSNKARDLIRLLRPSRHYRPC